MILAIETSCDDTCAAIVEPSGRRALSNVIHTQTEHARYGGVVPEVASRAHLERMDGVIERSLADAEIGLDEVERVAVTVRPGLIGALLVGVASAKGVAYARSLPLVPVNHLEGHVAAAYLADPTLEPPFVALIASGGHTALYSVDRDHEMGLLGETLDDAAGEALDKGARMLGLGFPGGPALQRAAQSGERDRYEFPVALKARDNLDFSFSGLKTSLLYRLKDLGEERTQGGAAAPRRELRGGRRRGARAQAFARGGPARGAGDRRRRRRRRQRPVASRPCNRESARLGTKLVIPPPDLCTDNAAMIGAAAPFTPAIAYPDYLSLNARQRVGRSMGEIGIRKSIVALPWTPSPDAPRRHLGSPSTADPLAPSAAYLTPGTPSVRVGCVAEG